MIFERKTSNQREFKCRDQVKKTIFTFSGIIDFKFFQQLFCYCIAFSRAVSTSGATHLVTMVSVH